MKTLLSVFFTLLTFTVFTQNEKRHLIGGGFSPEATFRTLPNAGVFDEMESFGFGFTAGFTYSKQLQWYSSFETGLLFSIKSIKKDYTKLTFGDQIDPRRGFIYNDGDLSMEFSGQHVFLEIPLKFNFYFTKSKVKPFAGIGISNGFFIGRMINYRVSNNANIPFILMMQGVVSLGVDFDFSNKITFRVEPQFKHAFFTVDGGGYIYKEYPYSIGCLVGLYYRFGK